MENVTICKLFPPCPHVTGWTGRVPHHVARSSCPRDERGAPGQLLLAHSQLPRSAPLANAPPADCKCSLSRPRWPFCGGVRGQERGTAISDGSGLARSLSLKHYIIQNGLGNCVQLLNLFDIFICLFKRGTKTFSWGRSQTHTHVQICSATSYCQNETHGLCTKHNEQLLQPCSATCVAHCLGYPGWKRDKLPSLAMQT